MSDAAERTTEELPEKMAGPIEFHAVTNPVTKEMELTAVYEPSEPTRLLAQLCVDIMSIEKASNFFTFEVTAPEMRVSITIQKMHGANDSPAAMLSRCNKENEALRKELDATRKSLEQEKAADPEGKRLS